MNITVDLSSPLVILPIAPLTYGLLAAIVGGIVARNSHSDDKLGMGLLCGIFWPITVLIIPFVSIGVWIATVGKKR